MKVLSLNCGSSSIRWGLYDIANERELLSGKVEEAHDAESAWPRIRKSLCELIGEFAPDAVGHRVVHGGEHFTEATRIDDAVLRAIESPLR